MGTHTRERNVCGRSVSRVARPDQGPDPPRNGQTSTPARREVSCLPRPVPLSGQAREAGDVRRSAAVVTSVLWFVLTGGTGAVLVPWWLTGWQARHPFPYWGRGSGR